MYCVIGLGNPGTEYTRTRHNVGFWVVDEVAINHRCSWQRKLRCDFSRVVLDGCKTLLVKPQTFMNLSGEGVQPIASYFRVDLDRLIVIHDDLDLGVGEVRVKVGGGSGGHRGLDSLVERFGRRDFIRVRVGIGRPDNNGCNENSNLGQGSASGVVSKSLVSNYVLGVPRPKEKELLDDAVSRASKAVIDIVVKGSEVAQRTYNRKRRTAEETDKSD